MCATPWTPLWRNWQHEKDRQWRDYHPRRTGGSMELSCVVWKITDQAVRFCGCELVATRNILLPLREAETGNRSWAFHMPHHRARTCRQAGTRQPFWRRLCGASIFRNVSMLRLRMPSMIAHAGHGKLRLQSSACAIRAAARSGPNGSRDPSGRPASQAFSRTFSGLIVCTSALHEQLRFILCGKKKKTHTRLQCPATRQDRRTGHGFCRNVNMSRKCKAGWR